MILCCYNTVIECLTPTALFFQGPDGTIGFAAGWTTRVSQYAPLHPKETSEDAKGTEAKEAGEGEEVEAQQDDGEEATPQEHSEPKEVST